MAVLVGCTVLGCAGNCGAAVRVGAWLRVQRRPGMAWLCARPLSAPQETIRRDVSGRCVRGALVFYLKRGEERQGTGGESRTREGAGREGKGKERDGGSNPHEFHRTSLVKNLLKYF